MNIGESNIDFWRFRNELKKFNCLEKESINDYALLKYPHQFSIMRMVAEKYNIDGFGSIMIMNTSVMKMMKLTTIEASNRIKISLL